MPIINQFMEAYSFLRLIVNDISLYDNQIFENVLLIFPLEL